MENSSKIIDIKNIYASKLQNYRDLQVYLPPSYDAERNKRYPVLYMHDGQNVFQPARGTGESWDLHTAVDKLITGGRIQEIIIVAILNKGTHRASEYLHYIDWSGTIPFKVECKGHLYEDFLVNDLKPYIDKMFRTIPDRENTALIGASMGGFVTYNIGLGNSDVFGKLGILSPYVTHIDLDSLIETPFFRTYQGKKPVKIWIDIGEAEGLFMVRHARDMVDSILRLGYKYGEDLYYYHVPEAGHSEKYWAERIESPLLYFFGYVGQPVAAQIQGRNVVGLKGMEVKANTIVKYDSGFAMTDLAGEYSVDNPHILEIMKDGTIIPKGEGTAKVTYAKGNLETSKEYTVVSELPENVKVSVSVKVPQDSPEFDTIYVHGLSLSNTGCKEYRGEYMLPRDIAFNFKIAKGGEVIEADVDGNDVPWRNFKASEDMELHYVVENWKAYDGIL